MSNKYRVIAEVTISVITDVEATSPEAAERIAANRGEMQGLCHQCCEGQRGYRDEQWQLTGELDGAPRVLNGQTILLDEEDE